MAGVARAGAGGAGLVEMAQIHGGTGLDGAGMEKRLGLGALGSEGRAAWRLSADASRNPVCGEAGVNNWWRMTVSHREPRTAGCVCGLGAAWIDSWAVGDRAAGHGFDRPPNGAAGIKRTRRLRSTRKGGGKGSAVVGKVSEKTWWGHPSFSLLWYELWYKLLNLLFLLVYWRRGGDSNPRTLAGQRFSRPPLSAAQPPLRHAGEHIGLRIAPRKAGPSPGSGAQGAREGPRDEADPDPGRAGRSLTSFIKPL